MSLDGAKAKHEHALSRLSEYTRQPNTCFMKIKHSAAVQCYDKQLLQTLAIVHRFS
jgi:hypothetical protein